MADGLITWVVRSLHVLGAAVWIGGYALMLFAILPRLAREPSEAIRRLAVAATRVLSLAGALTVLLGSGVGSS